LIRVDLPYPVKALWPNGRAHHQAKARAVKAHRMWADALTVKAVQSRVDAIVVTPLVRVHLVVHAKPKGPLPDRDNCVAAAKAYLDGIAQRLGINDRLFAAPTVEFAPVRDGRFVIEIGAPA
jgi:crossover junction endodeoxyribonuclease RusA